VMHPFWNQLIKVLLCRRLKGVRLHWSPVINRSVFLKPTITTQLCPRWIAPNVLTVSGFLLTVINAILLTYYDFDFSASSDTMSGTVAIPNWVWLVCMFNQFVSYNLDAIDGKQARRTGTSGPLGELMDHGLDSWTAFFIPFSIYSMFGRAEQSYPPIRIYFIFWSIFITFYFAHWEKYNTGILYLPWSYDVTHLALTAMYLVTNLYTYKIWKLVLPLFGCSTGQMFEFISHCKSFFFFFFFTFVPFASNLQIFNLINNSQIISSSPSPPFLHSL
jgi:phosphatidylglycerophosphate synthase